MIVRSTGLVLTLLLLSFGCGTSGNGDTVHLRGNVTLDGSPIPENAQASVTFQPIRGNEARPVTVPIKQSAYDSPNTPSGPIVATFNLNIPTGKMIVSERLGGEVPEIITVSLSPEQASGIQLDVQTKNEVRDFALTSVE